MALQAGLPVLGRMNASLRFFVAAKTHARRIGLLQFRQVRLVGLMAGNAHAKRYGRMGHRPVQCLLPVAAVAKVRHAGLEQPLALAPVKIVAIRAHASGYGRVDMFLSGLSVASETYIMRQEKLV
jgi:hypothetical protein